MTNIKVRLVTTKALVTAVVGFTYLPAKANPDFMEGCEGGVMARTSVAHLSADFKKNTPKGKQNPLDGTSLTFFELLNEIDPSKAKRVQKDPEIEAVSSRPSQFLEPLVQVDENGKVKSTAATKAMVKDLKDMNDLVYNMVKGYGLHQKRAQVILERLEAEGWKWKAFNGLEGLNSEFGINAGMVFYHPEKNLAKVVIAGTASNDEGWEVNGKANLTTLTAANLQKEYFDDLMREVEGIIKDALNPKEKALNPTTAVSQEVMNILHNKVDVGINYLDSAGIREVGARLNKLAINNPAMSQEELIQAAFTKCELEFKHRNILTRDTVEKKYMSMMEIISTELREDQKKVIAKVLAQEAIAHRQLVELSKDTDYQATLKKFLNETLKHLKNANHGSVKERLSKLFQKHKDEFETVLNADNEKKSRGIGNFKTFFKKNKEDKKPSFGPKTKEQTISEIIERNDDKSFGKAILAFGDLKLLVQNGKLDANKQLAEKLFRIFELKMQVMGTVSNLEDKAAARGKSIIGEGSVHLGFMQKSLSMVDEVAGILKDFGVDKNSKVVISGHSQGGGTGAQTLALLAEHYGEELFGEGFDNNKTHNLSGYLFSAARAGDQDYADYVNGLVGKSNVIRHNVHGDPVPIANGNDAFENWFKATVGPVAYSVMYKNMGFGDIGTLALQDGHETFKKAKAQYNADGYDVSLFESFDTIMQFIANGKLRSSVAAETERGFLGRLLQFGGRSVTDVTAFTSMGKKFFKAFVQHDEKTKEELGQLLTKRYAHFHLGYDEAMKDGTLIGAHFNPNLILDTDESLEYGQQHEESAETY